MLTHRLFPALLALWFAALFGLGCLVAGGDALAGLVLHLHLPAILPAAAPPLGLTARLMLAVMLAGLGGAIGLAIGFALFTRAGGVLPARPVRAKPAPAAAAPAAGAPEAAMRVRSRDAHPDAPPRRPLVVTEDVLPYPTAMVETPGMNDADADQSWPIAPGHADLPPFLAAAMSAVNQPPTAAAPLAPEPVAEPEPVVVTPEIVPLAEPACIVAPVPPIVPPITVPPLASVAAAAPNVPLVQMPLASLGLVQLIERLAQAIVVRQQHRAAVADQALANDPFDMRTPLHRFDPLTMDPTGPLLRVKTSRAVVAEEPDAHDPVLAGRLHDPLADVTDWEHDLDAAPDHADTAPEPARDGDDPAFEPAVEHRYSSLADMALPRPELVSYTALLADTPDSAPAMSDPVVPDPVVPFPSRLPASDTAAAATNPDRALRDALATLRQMTAHR